MVANECDVSECGSIAKCLLCANGILQNRMPFPSPELTNEQKRYRAAQRAARNLADLVRASGLDHLLTLSAGKSLHTHKDALDAFSGFLTDTRYGRWYNGVIQGRYVAVAECYSDGNGWHLHIATSGFLDPRHLKRLKRDWTAYLYHRHGIARPSNPSKQWRVHIKPPTKGCSPKNLGRYLAKYITKDLTELPLGTRRYRAGQGLSRPTKRVRYVRMTEEVAKSGLKDAYRVRDIITPDGTHLGWYGELDPLPPP